MPLTPLQREALVTSLHGYAENYQEVAASEPEDFDLVAGEALTWPAAMRCARDTLIAVFREDSLQEIVGRWIPEAADTGLRQAIEDGSATRDEVIAFIEGVPA